MLSNRVSEIMTSSPKTLPSDATLYSVPEPGSALAACGLALLLGRRKRRP